MTQSNAHTDKIVIAVDVMGADLGVKPLLKGLSRSAAKNPDLNFLIFGRDSEVTPILQKMRGLAGRYEFVHADDIVAMDDKPSQVMRRGKNTSMYAAITSIKEGRAALAISCGNTGALMALSMLILRRAPGITRPAIAVFWPSRNPQNYNVMLDGGADVRAEAGDLLNYAIMGASYVRNAFDVVKPRIGVLNVGTEEGKGRPELQEALELIDGAKDKIEIASAEFVESGALVGDKVDVIVTDGFTGNIALKTGEGTARFMGDEMRSAFTHSIFSRIGAMFAVTSLGRLKKRMDPRRSNGGVFLGLNGIVIKSHGSSDALAMSSAIKLGANLAAAGFHERLTKRLENTLGSMSNDEKTKDSK